MDHGSQYLADDFLNQIKHWDIIRSFAFVAEPQTNGVAERFNRTLKEQVVYGRTYRTVDDVASGRLRVRPDLQHSVAPRKARLPHPRRGAAAPSLTGGRDPGRVT